MKRIMEIVREKPYTIELAVKEVANSIWKRVKLLKDIDENNSINHFRRSTQANKNCAENRAARHIPRPSARDSVEK